MPTELKNSPPPVGEAKGFPMLIGVAMGFGIFLLLPITQWIDALGTSSNTRVEFASQPPPPPPIVMEEPEQEKEEKEDIKDLKDEPPPPSLEMLELALNADMSSMMGGDFAMPTIDVASELEEMVYDIKDLDKRPTAVVQTEPIYPAELQRAGIGGSVVSQFVVTAAGTVRDITIIDSTNSGFNDSVIRAIRTWRFEPGEKAGKKVNTRVQIQIPFNVDRRR